MTKRGELTPGQQRAAAGGGALALASAALVAFLQPWEGKSNDPYRDVVGVRTVCFGETNVPMRRYSDEECILMLARGTRRYLEAVQRRNPRIVEDPLQWAAHGELAYNIGVDGYNRSTVARLYSQGREIDACRYIGRYRYAGGRVWRGLVLRREGDATRLGSIELCLMTPPAPYARPERQRA